MTNGGLIAIPVDSEDRAQLRSLLWGLPMSQATTPLRRRHLRNLSARGLARKTGR